MLRVIPQFVKYYTRPEFADSVSYSYIIPRRITQDNLENRFGDIKLDLGHNGFNAKNVVHSAHNLEVSSIQKVAARVQKKRNCLGASITIPVEESSNINVVQDEPKIVDLNEELKSNELKEIARFNPLITLESRLERERQENKNYLDSIHFIERIQQLRLSTTEIRKFATES